MEDKKINIMVPKGIAPVHMFDVYGVILDADKMAENAVNNYRQVAQDTGVNPEAAEKVISEYQALVRGEPWATGARKVEIIQALQAPLDKAGVKASYNGCFMQDGIYVVKQILDSGEGVSIFSSGNNDAMRPELPEGLGERVGKMYDVSKFTYQTEQKKRTKSEPAAFTELSGLERQLGREVISHTADELPELVAAVKSGVIPARNLVYVNRNNSNSAEAVQAAGIGRYVQDLREVPYASMAQTESLRINKNNQ